MLIYDFYTFYLLSKLKLWYCKINLYHFIYKEENSIIEKAPQSLEKIMLSELDAQSLEEVHDAMKKGEWPFKIEPKNLWKK